MTLYRMELDDETGEPYYEPITAADIVGLESAAMARVSQHLPTVESAAGHPSGCRLCFEVVVRHTINVVLESFRPESVCLHGVPLKHAHCCPPE